MLYRRAVVLHNLMPVLPGARCVGLPDWLFFPNPGEGSESGRAVCEECPARAACLEWALTNHPQAGIWGSTTLRQRAKLRTAAPAAV